MDERAVIVGAFALLACATAREPREPEARGGEPPARAAPPCAGEAPVVLEQACAPPRCRCTEVGSAQIEGARVTSLACVDDRSEPDCLHRDCRHRRVFGLLRAEDERGRRHYRSELARETHPWPEEEAIVLVVEDSGDAEDVVSGRSGIAVVRLDPATDRLCDLGTQIVEHTPGETDAVAWYGASDLRRRLPGGECRVHRVRRTAEEGLVLEPRGPCLCERAMTPWTPDEACARDGRVVGRRRVRWTTLDARDLVETVECAHPTLPDIRPEHHLRLVTADGRERWHRNWGDIARVHSLGPRDALELDGSTHAWMFYDATLEGVCFGPPRR